MPKKLTIGIFALIALTVLSACSGGAGKELSVEDILQNAADATLATQSVQFAIERDGEPPIIDSSTNSRFISLTGFYQAPDTVQATVRAETPLGVQDLEIIWSPEGNSMTIPGLGTLDLPEDFSYQAPEVFQAEGLPNVLTGAVVNASLVGQEALNGANVYHITGTASGEDLGSLTAGAINVEDMNLDLFIDTETFEVARIILTESSGDSWLIELFAYNEPVGG